MFCFKTQIILYSETNNIFIKRKNKKLKSRPTKVLSTQRLQQKAIPAEFPKLNILYFSSQVLTG
jgi:hypothetical protein